MIASATQLGDPRARAKRRLRAAARGHSETGATKASKTPAWQAASFIKEHPAAAAATVLALTAVFGPFRLIRFGMAAARTVSMVTGASKFVKSLPASGKSAR